MAWPDEIWLVDFGVPFPSEPAHRRPALVVGPPAAFGTGMPFVLVCPLTTVHRGLSLHLELEPEPSNGLSVTSYIQCEQLRSIGTHRLIERLGVIDATSSAHVWAIARTLLGL